jgi:outer membrane protein TolC
LNGIIIQNRFAVMFRRNLITFLIILSLGKIADAHPLDYYITAALNNSPLLKDYHNQILSAGLDSLLVKATNKPQINQVTQIMYPFMGNNWGYDEAITNGGNYSALLSVLKPLLNNKVINGHVQNISLQSQSLRVTAKISEIDLKKGVTAQYLTAFTNLSQFQSNKSVLKLLQDEQNVIKILAEKGVYLATDYMNLSISVRAQEITIRQSFIQYKNDLNLLNFLCGIADTATVILENPGQALAGLNNYYDLENSPIVAQFKLDSLKNLNNRLLVDLNYRPKLHAFADGGFASVMPKNIPYNFGASVGLNLTMVISDGKQRKLQYDQISLAENSRQDYQKFYSTQYKQQHNQLREQLKLSDELINALKNQLAEQEKLIGLYKLEIEQGLVRVMDFMAIVNNYTATKNNFTQAEINRLQIINQMNYLK